MFSDEQRLSKDINRSVSSYASFNWLLAVENREYAIARDEMSGIETFWTFVLVS